MLEINICLLPNKSIKTKAISQSKTISSKYSTQFTLNNQNSIPHISIYHLGIPDDNLGKLIKEIENIASITSPIEIKLGDYTNLDTFIFWQAKKTKTLINFQEKVIKLTNPLRKNTQRKAVEDYVKDLGIKGSQLENVKKYGYPLIGDEFDPHITITKLKHKKDTVSILKRYSPEPETFNASLLIVGLIGPFGTLPKIIREYKLK